jgi:hypothetical protein
MDSARKLRQQARSLPTDLGFLPDKVCSGDRVACVNAGAVGMPDVNENVRQGLASFDVDHANVQQLRNALEQK